MLVNARRSASDSKLSPRLHTEEINSARLGSDNVGRVCDRQSNSTPAHGTVKAKQEQCVFLDKSPGGFPTIVSRFTPSNTSVS